MVEFIRIQPIINAFSRKNSGIEDIRSGLSLVANKLSISLTTNFQSESLDFLDLTTFCLTSTDPHLAYVVWLKCIQMLQMMHFSSELHTFGMKNFFWCCNFYFKSVQIIILSKFGSYLDTYSLIFVGGLWYLIKYEARYARYFDSRPTFMDPKFLCTSVKFSKFLIRVPIVYGIYI